MQIPNRPNSRIFKKGMPVGARGYLRVPEAFKEASFYADFTTQDYAYGTNLVNAATFSEAFGYGRDSVGYVFNPAGVLTEYATDIPRFEYDPLTTAPKGLLIEPAQTNLLIYASEFDNAVWTKQGGLTVTGNAVSAPDGTTTADALTDPVTSGACLLFQISAGASAVGAMTASMHVRNFGTDVFTFNPYVNGETETNATFDFSSESLGTTGGNNLGSSFDALAGDFYRIKTSFNSLSAGSDVPFRIWPTRRDAIYQVDTGSIYAWGAQLVTGPYAGSYIPTGATTATRAADLLEVKPAVVADVVSATEGTVFVEATVFDLGRSQRLVTLHGNSGDDRIQIDVASNGSMTAAVYVNGSATLASISFGTITFGTKFKAVLTYGSGRVSVVLNGGTVAESTGLTLPPAFDAMQWFADQAGGTNCAALSEEVGVFMVAKSDAQAQSLSS